MLRSAGQRPEKENRVNDQATPGRSDDEMQTLLGELKNRLLALYGGRLSGMVLFGSYARGSAHAGSDMDVAMILESYERTWPEIDRTGPTVAELSLKYGVTISLIPVRKKDWEANRTLLPRSLHRKGILVG
jgi:predicted nucleotidyltransferase